MAILLKHCQADQTPGVRNCTAAGPPDVERKFSWHVDVEHVIQPSHLSKSLNGKYDSQPESELDNEVLSMHK